MIDCHIHLDELKECEIQEGIKNGIKFITTSFGYKSLVKNLRIKGKFCDVKVFMGVHPERKITYKETNKLIKFFKKNYNKIDGIGEIGIPYFNIKKFSRKEIAKSFKIMKKLLKLASFYDKPITFHIVGIDIFKVFPLLDKYKIKKVLFHWYIGNDEVVKEIVKRKYLISINPHYRIDEDYKKYIKKLDLSCVVLESDAPFGYIERVVPKDILGMYEELGKIWQLDFETIKNTIEKNNLNFIK